MLLVVFILLFFFFFLLPPSLRQLDYKVNVPQGGVIKTSIFNISNLRSRLETKELGKYLIFPVLKARFSRLREKERSQRKRRELRCWVPEKKPGLSSLLDLFLSQVL